MTFLPRLRDDIDVIPQNVDGKEVVLLFDPIASDDGILAINAGFADLLSLFTGKISMADLPKLFDGEWNLIEPYLQELKSLLEKHNLVYSEIYLKQKEARETKFESESIRPMILAGKSYPENPNEVSILLKKALTDVEATESPAKPESIYGLYAPHLDLRVALDHYAKAFSVLREKRFSHVYLIGTSHYASLYPIYDEAKFIFSAKDFQTPFGTVKNDTQKTKALFNSVGTPYASMQDRAHSNEHSLEIHLLWLHYLSKQPFTITPVLVSGLSELIYSKKNSLYEAVKTFSMKLHEFCDEESIVLISGDLAHVGNKFGDPNSAESFIKDVNHYDKRLLKMAIESDADGFLDVITSNYDAYRICGFPPLYSFLLGAKELQGELIAYDVWDEKERNSAVTIGSVLFTKQ